MSDAQICAFMARLDKVPIENSRKSGYREEQPRPLGVQPLADDQSRRSYSRARGVSCNGWASDANWFQAD
jgi:hypothetical protein